MGKYYVGRDPSAQNFAEGPNKIVCHNHAISFFIVYFDIGYLQFIVLCVNIQSIYVDYENSLFITLSSFSQFLQVSLPFYLCMLGMQLVLQAVFEDPQ